MKEVSERERYLPPALIGKLLRIAAERPDIISLGVGEPDFTPPKVLVKEVKRVIAKYKKNRVTHYAASEGIPELREAIVEKLKRDNKIRMSPENVLVTTGSQEALFVGFLATLDPTEEVILQNPGYLGYVPAIELCSGVPRYVPAVEQENFEINPDRMNKLVNKKTRVIVLNTPSNPTGTVIRRSVLEEIADIAVDKDLYIFSDEAYEKLIYDDAKHVSIGSFNGMHDYVVTFQTFSKSYAMCGFRLGYAAGPREVIQAMTKSVHYVTLSAPHLSQWVGVKALSLGRQHIDPMVREYDRRRKFIVRRLNEMGLTTPAPKGAFYAFSNIQQYGKNSVRFTEKLLKKSKVAVVPGTEFGVNGEGYVRFSYAADYHLIETAMQRLERFLKKR